MVARGDEFGGSPGACPFVALDNDRDKRSDQPDYRHRCYAEPTPAPRALAHQEAFCLSPSFPACPIFQDWAARAAARPVAAPAGYKGREAAVAAAMVGAAAADEGEPAAAVEPAQSFEPVPAGDDDLPAASESAASNQEVADELADEPVAAAAADAIDAADAADADRAEQLGAFDAPIADQPEPDLDEYLTPAIPIAAASVPLAAAADDMEPVRPPYEPSDEEDIPPVPPFLADRPAAPVSEAALAAAIAADEAAAPRSSAGRAPSVERVRREDFVPSWDIDGRYGAQAGGEPPDDRSGSGVLTAIAVIAILALGVAGVIFLPGMLAGGPAQTIRPSLSALPSSSSSLAPTASLATPTAPASATATAGEPTDSPAPTASPRTYRIKSGDTLARIARRNDITVADIIAANPEITDPNDIFVGQIIIIPQPLPTAAP